MSSEVIVKRKSKNFISCPLQSCSITVNKTFEFGATKKKKKRNRHVSGGILIESCLEGKVRAFFGNYNYSRVTFFDSRKVIFNVTTH